MSNLEQALSKLDLSGKRVVAVIPDRTRTAPVGRMVKKVLRTVRSRGGRLDVLVALGTHPPLTRESFLEHLEITDDHLEREFRDVAMLNHEWDNQNALTRIGTISSSLVVELTDGMLRENVAVTLNKSLLDYDHVVIIGPVFPHEVAGFSGGTKYLFPGVSGPEMVDFTHWLAALITTTNIIGKKQNPVRRVMDEAAGLVPVPVTAICMVMRHHQLSAVFAGQLNDAWPQAADLSARVNVVTKNRQFNKVLACAPSMYEDMWTGAKCMYKCEKVVADGGELVIYAPHIRSFSLTHEQLIENVGYHIRDYFVNNIDKFDAVPRTVLAAATYLKGTGTYINGVESTRIRVTLSTGISEQACNKVGLGYLNPGAINPNEWAHREHEGVLLVKQAGEVLYTVGGESQT